jgi:peptidoglycan hydrolase-like protein with peptidoglycan-binding domain
MSNAAAAFSAQENAIKINFDIQRSPFEDIIQAGQRAIADIQNRAGGLDDLDADLQRIANKEFEINKAYDEKIKALDEVAKINDKIIAQQKSQLGLADALSRGDIAGAAKAAQDMRAQASAGSIAEQRSMLDESRKLEVEGLTGTGGLTREQIEEKIRDLKAQILEIEEKRIEPAQRQMELLERMQQDQIDALTVLGKTREEWDGINASLELANTKTKEFQDAMREALTIATTLGTALATGVVPTVGSMPVPAKPPAPAAPARTPYSYPGQVSSGSRGDTVSKLQSALNVGGAGLAVDGQFGPKTRQAVVNFQSSQGLAADGIAGPLTWKKLYDVQYFKKGGKVAYMKKGGKMSYMKKGGLMSYMNAGGMVPYMAMGGIANMLAKGTDTIPAMLTAGEFVMSKPAVDKIGVGRLAQLNRGYDRNTNNKSDSVYNYSISVNASTNANPREIANTVLDQIKQIDQQRVRGNRFNYAQ